MTSSSSYIVRSGEQVFPPPYDAAGVQLYSFGVRIDRATLQREVCDRCLNAPLGGGDRFVPAADHAMFVFNSIDKLSSRAPGFEQRGWFAEQEAAVWTVIADRVREQLFWFHPYMLVDNSYAMAMGREIYGFPKSIGWFDIPRGPDAPDRLSVQTLAVRRFAPDAPGERLPLFTVRRVAENGAPHGVFEGLKDLVQEIALLAGLEPGFFAELGLGAHMLEALVERLMPMAFLKQFRDGALPDRACYQAIQEVDSKLVRLLGARLFSDRYVVEIEDLDSHPLRRDLGLPAGPVPVEFAAWLNFDFSIGNTRIVWSNLPGSATAAEAPPPTAPIAPTVPSPPASAPPASPASALPASGDPNPPPPPRQRIAILGGGVSAIATAWRLSSEPGWQQRFDITVYQMGWRLGGKGASGRRPPHGRIEEHGLHIWLGFYHNAFRALQAAHEVLNPGVTEVPAGHQPPRLIDGLFARCEDAFQPHSYVGADMKAEDGWDPWMMNTPTTDDKPWQGGSLPSAMAYAKMLGEFLSGRAFSEDTRAIYRREACQQHEGVLGWLKEQAEGLLIDVGEVLWSVGFGLSSAVSRLTEALHDDPQRHAPAQHALLLLVLDKLQAWLAHEFVRLTENDPGARRHLLMVDLSVAMLRGLLADHALRPGGLAQLDDEFRSWLQRHGAMPVSASLDSNPLLRGLYDFVFAFDGGVTSAGALDRTANFATGPALRTILRMCFTYDGALFWKMRAGMGDTVFTPFYRALRQRGVQFKFFHRVKALRLDAGGRGIDRIEMARQVTPRGDYQPLQRWQGLDCWPAEADYSQLEEGEALHQAVAAQGIDLESAWFQWPDAQPALSLQRGRDFDQVVFGISLGSVPLVAADLVAADQRWQAMVAHVKTVRTQALQLWLKPDLAGLGWQTEAPVLDAFIEPFDTWADMSHLLPREDWSGADDVPASVAYFCGALEDDAGATPAQALAAAREDADGKLLADIDDLWPDAALPAGGLNPALVIDRYDRANIEPSERYVLSVAGSTGHRLKANASGFDNLVLTGDWIDNGFNAGCVEAAFMAGLQAANVLLGKADLNDGVIGRELC